MDVAEPPKRSARTTRARAAKPENQETSTVAEEKVTVRTKVAAGKRAAVLKTEIDVEETLVATKKRKAKGTGRVKTEDEDQAEEEAEEGQNKPKKKRKTKAIPAEDGEDDKDDSKPKKKRRTKEEIEAEANMVLASRTATHTLRRAMFIGAHVSAAGGVHNSIPNASKIGANAFALFLKSQRKWESPPLQDEHRDEFHVRLKQHDYDATKHILPHGSYLVNLAQPDAERAKQAYDSFLDDLQRCEALGIRLYNFHPGSTAGETMESACGRIAAQLNRAHKETKSVVTLLEVMCGGKNVVGSKFEELRDIIALVEDKTRVGVCLDTCHAFTAGYDLRTPEAFAETMSKFDEIIGLKYLKALHLNDSKAPFASHRDLHANIGTGFLGLRAFHNVMNYEPFQHLPIVLETPIEVKGPDGKMVEDKRVWADEIKLLESLIDMDIETKDFAKKEAELQARGASERERIQGQVDRKAENEVKKAENEVKKALRAAKKELEQAAKTGQAAKRAKKKAGRSEKVEPCDSCGEESD